MNIIKLNVTYKRIECERQINEYENEYKYLDNCIRTGDRASERDWGPQSYITLIMAMVCDHHTYH